MKAGRRCTGTTEFNYLSSVILQETRVLQHSNLGAQGKEPAGAGNLGADLSIREHSAVRHLGERLQMTAVYQLDPVPVFSFHSKNTVGATL